MNIKEFLVKKRIPMSKTICGSGKCTQVGKLLVDFRQEMLAARIDSLRRLVRLYQKYTVLSNYKILLQGSELSEVIIKDGKDLTDEDIIFLFERNKLL